MLEESKRKSGSERKELKMKRRKHEPETERRPWRTCGDCIHEYACAMWNVGTLQNTDATNCVNFQRLEDLVTIRIMAMRNSEY